MSSSGRRSKQKPIEWTVTVVAAAVYSRAGEIVDISDVCRPVKAIAESITGLDVSGFQLARDKPVRISCACRACMKAARTTR